MGPGTATALATAAASPLVSRVDFRRPSGFTRDAVRNLAAVHELLTRRIATGWGAQLRAVVQLEEVGVDQVTYQEYLASMPSPNTLALVEIPPLPAPVIIELNTQLALTLVDRLLGGRGANVSQLGAVRRLTEVETSLLSYLLGHVTAGLGEALGPATDGTPRLVGIEYNPQLVQIAAPSDRVVLLTYRVSITQGLSTEGLLTVCYPSAAATPLLESVGGPSRHEEGSEAQDTAPDGVLVDRLHDVPVDLRVRLAASQVPAADLQALRVGDVLRLDHRVDQPMVVTVGEAPVGLAHLGRRASRRAIQLASPPAATSGERPVTTPPGAGPS